MFETLWRSATIRHKLPESSIQRYIPDEFLYEFTLTPEQLHKFENEETMTATASIKKEKKNKRTSGGSGRSSGRSSGIKDFDDSFQEGKTLNWGGDEDDHNGNGEGSFADGDTSMQDADGDDDDEDNDNEINTAAAEYDLPIHDHHRHSGIQNDDTSMPYRGSKGSGHGRSSGSMVDPHGLGRQTGDDDEFGNAKATRNRRSKGGSGAGGSRRSSGTSAGKKPAVTKSPSQAKGHGQGKGKGKSKKPDTGEIDKQVRFE